MLDNYGDKTTKAGILTGNPIIGVVGAGASLIGTGMQVSSDYQMDNYNPGNVGAGVLADEEVLTGVGNTVIDSKIKNPVLKKGAKIILQESVRQGGNAINKKTEK